MTSPRRRGVDVFIAAWLLLQIVLPLVAGLDFSNGRYFNGPFSWSMYAHLRLRCEMSLWVVDEGVRTTVEGFDRLAKWAPGAEPERCSFGYPKEGDAEAQVRNLVDEIAARRADGRRYGA
ncbi:MAG: hypothetical protein JRG83_21765, partial [Deltaproteobacteria bacterium]|nr:hypothetical protein [Deltaproteobacteria bacterium]